MWWREYGRIDSQNLAMGGICSEKAKGGEGETKIDRTIGGLRETIQKSEPGLASRLLGGKTSEMRGECGCLCGVVGGTVRF